MRSAVTCASQEVREVVIRQEPDISGHVVAWKPPSPSIEFAIPPAAWVPVEDAYDLTRLEGKTCNVLLFRQRDKVMHSQDISFGVIIGVCGRREGCRCRAIALGSRWLIAPGHCAKRRRRGRSRSAPSARKSFGGNTDRRPWSSIPLHPSRWIVAGRGTCGHPHRSIDREACRGHDAFMRESSRQVGRVVVCEAE